MRTAAASGTPVAATNTATSTRAQKAALRVGYWNIRGVFQPVRLLLKYLEIPYEERRYTWKVNAAGDDWDQSDWLEERSQLGLDFPNLPWLKDSESGVRLSHQDPIMRYLCEKYAPELLGRTIQERAFVNMLWTVLSELRLTLSKHAYLVDPDKSPKGRAQVISTLRSYAALVVQQKRGHVWLAGDRMTVADVFFFEVFDIGRTMVPDAFEDIPELKKATEVMLAFEQLPAIHEYLNFDPDFIKRPVFGIRANFR